MSEDRFHWRLCIIGTLTIRRRRRGLVHRLLAIFTRKQTREPSLAIRLFCHRPSVLFDEIRCLFSVCSGLLQRQFQLRKYINKYLSSILLQTYLTVSPRPSKKFAMYHAPNRKPELSVSCLRACGLAGSGGGVRGGPYLSSGCVRAKTSASSLQV